MVIFVSAIAQALRLQHDVPVFTDPADGRATVTDLLRCVIEQPQYALAPCEETSKFPCIFGPRAEPAEGTEMDQEHETSAATAMIGLTVIAVEPVHRSKLFALISAEVEIEGIAVIVHGIQAVRETMNIRIEMPRFRDGNGAWRNAVTLPDEVKAPLTAAVLEALVEHGLAKRGFA